MRLKLFVPIAVLSVAAPLAARADIGGTAAPSAPTAPTSAQDRSVDPVVLAGNQFPSWSAGPELVAREPGSPLNSSTVDQQGNGPQQAQSDCYHPGQNPYDPSDNGDHNCVQSSRLPSANNTAADAANGALNTNIGADVDRIVGYRWDASRRQFVQFPLQVDEKFTRFLSNNASGFAFYSGVDQETNYAFDREGFRYSSDQSQTTAGGDPCVPEPAKGSPDLNAKGYSAQADPIRGLDDNDEVAFMWRDAGAAAAPAGTTLPSGVLSSYQIAVADPSNPAAIRYAYVALASSDTEPGWTQKVNPHGKPVGGPPQTIAQWNAEHGYVHYTRDATADIFQYSQSSYGDYGAAPKGPYCTINADGTHTPSTVHGTYAQRRPGDGAWVTTARYAFRYDGRWLMTQLRICPARAKCGLDDTGVPQGYGDNIIDQWKARAFQQRPSGTTPCCGYEEEVNNWGGSSILFGERWGSVRVIRAAWGSDSSTNNIKTEVFYPDTISFGDNLRVHVIPPFDGIYVMWDYRAGKVATYYNPWQPAGARIDGANDEVFGNQRWTVQQGGVEVQDTDNVPVVGPQDVKVGTTDPNGDCHVAGQKSICNDIDMFDPAFDGPVGALNWEEIAGANGGVVTRWSVKQHSAGDAYSLIATPYYRDDSCFDDGTGSDPGIHVRPRSVDSGEAATYFDPSDPTGGANHDGMKPRVCWQPSDGDPHDASIGDGRPRKFWNADIATHGLHLNLIADSDNAYQTEPIDEVDSVQRMVVLPPEVVDPTRSTTGTVNVGEQYGRSVEFPLQPVVTPFS
ncbi:MAG: hypothetical protein QOC82_793 [Frankiaceae bacterium]|jgi:hypothetical protein|nr:hypothetical protein [Frankiaceae bacterium]